MLVGPLWRVSELSSGWGMFELRATDHGPLARQAASQAGVSPGVCWRPHHGGLFLGQVTDGGSWSCQHIPISQMRTQARRHAVTCWEARELRAQSRSSAVRPDLLQKMTPSPLTQPPQGVTAPCLPLPAPFGISLLPDISTGSPGFEGQLAIVGGVTLGKSVSPWVSGSPSFQPEVGSVCLRGPLSPAPQPRGLSLAWGAWFFILRPDKQALSQGQGEVGMLAETSRTLPWLLLGPGLWAGAPGPLPVGARPGRLCLPQEASQAAAAAVGPCPGLGDGCSWERL